MRYRVNQWRVKTEAGDQYLFTASSDTEIALAIAIATFGSAITGLEDEGTISVQITDVVHLAILEAAS